MMVSCDKAIPVRLIFEESPIDNSRTFASRTTKEKIKDENLKTIMCQFNGC